jgi:WD40 repeat protein
MVGIFVAVVGSFVCSFCPHHLISFLPLDGHSGWDKSCSFSPSGHYIYSASEDGNLVMWTAGAGQLDGIVDKDSNLPPRSICASSDGKYIVSGHEHGTVKMWRMGRGSPID